MSKPRTRGRDDSANEVLNSKLLALYDVCERQGRNYLTVKAALPELLEASNVDELLDALLPLIDNDPREQAVNAAAAKDARRAIGVAIQVLQRIAGNLDDTVVKAASRSRKPPPNETCPAGCGREMPAKALPTHLRSRHGWSEEQLNAWRTARGHRVRVA